MCSIKNQCRKSNTEITVTTNKKSLRDTTGVEKDLGLKMTADKASQTEQIEIVQDFFEDETNHYLLLELIANDQPRPQRFGESGLVG